MKRPAHLSIVPAVALASVLAGCAVETSAPTEALPFDPEPAVSGVPHPMLTDQARAARASAARTAPIAQASTTQVTYHGGPVIQNVNLVPVFWTSAVQFQVPLALYYHDLTTIYSMSFFSEYDTTTPLQKIKAGTETAAFVDSSTKTTVSDADIQAELIRLFNAGSVPSPTNNNLYAVHFPPGVTINLQGQLSCEAFCAYHSAFQVNGASGLQDVFYTVVPDQGGSCAGHCGSATNQFTNTQLVTSNEYSEAITDPAGSLATGFNAPTGWVDTANGEEIGDLCAGQIGDIIVIRPIVTVQREWSNSAGLCVNPGV